VSDNLADLKNMERPPLVFEFSEGSGREPLKMTYGLEMDLRRLLPDPNTAMQLVLVDPFTQDFVIRRCLTDKKKIITDIDELIPVEEVDLDSDELDKLLIWAVEHAIYFFVKRTAGMGELGQRMEPQFPSRQDQMKPSTSGSENSASTTPSAGPSDVSKET
jgi:hypothetical protein